MAKQGKFMTGSMGRVVFYELNGQSIMRSKPERMKQTKATKASAKEFGRMSRYSKWIREYWALLGQFDQRELMWRLNSALLRWNKDSMGDQQLMSRNIQDLRTFELNPDSLLSRNCKVAFQVDMDQPGIVLISTPSINPAKDIIAPPYMHKVKFTWVLVRCSTDPKQRIESNWKTEQTEILLETAQVPEQQIEMQMPTFPGDIILVALRLTYYNNEKDTSEVKEKKWMPAGVVAAGYREMK